MTDKPPVYDWPQAAIDTMIKLYLKGDSASQIASLTAENERLREALKAILPYVATQSIGCHGDKCREIWCYSCNGEDDANFAAMAGAEAFLIAHAALQPKEDAA